MATFAKALLAFTGASFIGTATQIAKGKLSAVFLGVAGVGVVNQVVGVWGLASLMAGLGFYSGMVRHLSESWARDSTIDFQSHLTSSAIVTFLASLLLTIAGCLGSEHISRWVFGPAIDHADLISLMLLGLPVFTLSQVYRAILSATNSVKALVRARIFADLSSVALFAALIYAWNIRGAVLGYAGLHVLYLLAVMYLSRNRVNFREMFSIRHFKTEQVRKNIPFGVNAIIASSVGIVSTLTVGRHLIETMGLAANGLFATAMKVTTAYLGGLAAAASGQVFPEVARCKTSEEMVGVINQVLRVYFLVIPPVIVVLMGLGPDLMRVLFSEEFVPAAALLLIILPADLFRIFAETTGIPLMAIKRLKLSTGLYIVWASLYVSLVFLLGAKWALIGYALAYLLSQCCYAVLVYGAALKTYGFRLTQQNAHLISISLCTVAVNGAVLHYSADRMVGLLCVATLLSTWTLLFRAELKRVIAGMLKRRSSKK